MFELRRIPPHMARLRELVAELGDIDPEGGWTVQLVDYYCWERDKGEGDVTLRAGHRRRRPD